MPRGDLVTQRGLVAVAIARREVERHDLLRAHAPRDLAGLSRREMVLAQRLVAVAVEEDRLDVQHVDAVEQEREPLDVVGREAEVGDVADAATGDRVEDERAQLADAALLGVLAGAVAPGKIDRRLVGGAREHRVLERPQPRAGLLYTSDAADERSSV